MGMAVSETPRHKLKKYSAGSDPHPTRTTFNEEADKLEAMPSIKQGSTGSRPLPGVGKVLYWDEAIKRFLYDDGTDWADVAPIGGVTPSTVTAAGAAAEGTSVRAARADHTHPMPLATGSTHGAMSSTDKAKLDAATANATANTVAMRSTGGRMAAGTPVAAGDVAIKSYVDTETAKRALLAHGHAGEDITSGTVHPDRIANATSLLDGLMPKADKSKLDAATAYVTASTLIFRNASGLFEIAEPVSSTHPATLGYVNARRAFAVDSLGATENLDNFITPGNFHQSGNAGAGTGTNYPAAFAGLLEVRVSGSFVYQTYTVYSAAGSGANGIYWRGRYNTTWSAWARIADTKTATSVLDGLMPKADKVKLDAATSNATASTLVIRDTAGAIGVGAPTLGGHAARKDYVDTETAKRALLAHGHAGEDITSGTVHPDRIANATAAIDGLMPKADKTKLDGIEPGATKLLLGTASTSAARGDHTHPLATAALDGLLPKADKAKLDAGNLVVPVNSTAARDALTVPDGAVVVRLDQGGALDRRVSGAWVEGRPSWTDAGGGISYRFFAAAGMVEVRVVVTMSLPVGITDLAVGAIPANLRATGTNPRGEALLSSGNMLGQIYVDNSSGNIGCINQSGAARTAVQGRIVYSVG